MIEVVADRSSDGMDGPVKIKDKHEINIHIHHDQQNPVHVLDDKVQQLAYEAARKAIAASKLSSNDTSGNYSKGPPASKPGTGITITTGGQQMMSPYAGYPGYPMPYPPFGMPGMPGGGVSINIQKDESAGDIVKKALGEEWANIRKTSSGSGTQSESRNNLDHAEEDHGFQHDRQPAVRDEPFGRPPGFAENRADHDHGRGSLNTYGGGHYGGNRGQKSPAIDATMHEEDDHFEGHGLENDSRLNDIDDLRVHDHEQAERNWQDLRVERTGGTLGHIGDLGEMEWFKDSAGKAADGMLNTANVVREESEKASNNLVDLHVKIHDWHQSVKDQTVELNQLQKNIQKLWAAAKDTLEEHDQKRMARFNTLIKNAYGGTDCVGPCCDVSVWNPEC